MSRPEAKKATGGRHSVSSKTYKGRLNKKIAVPDDKPDQKSITSSASTKNHLKSKNELLSIFVTELLGTIISKKDTAYSNDLPSSYESFGKKDFSNTVHDEIEEESKKSVTYFSINSKSSVHSERLDATNLETESKDGDRINVIRRRTNSALLLENRSSEIFQVKSSQDEWKEDLCSSTTMKIHFTNGNNYEGDMENCLMHGLGTYTWNDGTVYEGEFKNGYPTGKGNMVLPDQSTYTGEFLIGHFHGEGTLNISFTSMIYKGQWKDGKRHGKGWVSYGPDNWYDGDWLEDQKHGFGYRQYKRGLKYQGEWSGDDKHGQGRMIWDNNDYYEGQWQFNHQHGYGEYTWNICYNNYFIFLIYNWYKGAWIKGKRTGIGLMHFGTETGSKLVGTWRNNLKDGPGILSSGNGDIIACNPLFENDKPVHKTNLVNASEIESLKEDTIIPIDQTALIHLYRKLISMINKKEPLDQLTQDICEQITTHNMSFSQNFEKLHDDSSNYSIWYPLKISIHVVAESINFSYYVTEILSHCKISSIRHSSTQLNRQITYAPEYFATRFQDEVYNKQMSEEEFFRRQQINEERLLKNFLILHVQKFRTIYSTYTKFTYPETKTKPILVRLFLWQLLRDIKIYHTVSLVEADLHFSSNPWSCAESNHNPFEEIYFWQFLQYLVGCSWLIYQRNLNNEQLPKTGIVTHIFKTFLDKILFPNYGKFEGTALKEHRDLLPIKGVYHLYCSVGEPHTIRAFLNSTCMKLKKEPPCYFGSYINTEETEITYGYNAVPVGNSVNFIKTKSITTPNAESTSDIFRNTLFTFRSLGRGKLMQCILTVYPTIKKESESVDMNYKINFLEFLELILLCGYEKADGNRKADILKHLEEKKSVIAIEPQGSLSTTRAARRNGSKRKQPSRN